MPRAIDEEKIKDAKALDIAKPPTKDIPFMEFPHAVYLHPADKTKEHRVKVVQTQRELDASLKKGWKKTPHVPEVVEIVAEDWQAEVAQ